MTKYKSYKNRYKSSYKYKMNNNKKKNLHLHFFSFFIIFWIKIINFIMKL